MDKTKKKIKLWSFILGLIILLQVIGTVIFFRNSNRILASNMKQINSLIDEIGQVKEENQLLHDEIEKSSDHQTDQLANINKETQEKDLKLQNLLDYQEYLKNQQNQLESQKTELVNQLSQKDQQLDTLKKTKNLEKNFSELNDKIYAILILGQNQKLTDTILLAIINPDKEKITLLSIPRDLYVEGRKINEFMEFYGVSKTEELIQKITGIKPDKYLELDFQAFKDIIDSIGGVDIQIDKAIVDKSYPNENNNGYRTVKFDPGWEKMDGARALEYARSRKSTSDFDRSLRQQKIIISLKEKIKSLNVMNNIQLYINAYQSLSANLDSDLNILDGIQMFEKYKNFQISAGNILDNQNFLYSSKSLTGQFILLPKDQSFQDFQQKILEII
jgi:LCP family protein required for cell wall assembly